jgi:hypothetical protein
MTTRDPLDPRAEELLCLDALDGLDEAEARELAALLGDRLDDERDAFALAAAAVDLAYHDPAATMADALRARILAEASDHLPPAPEASASAPEATAPSTAPASATPSASADTPAPADRTTVDPPATRAPTSPAEPTKYADGAKDADAGKDADGGKVVSLPRRSWIPWLIAAASFIALLVVASRPPPPAPPPQIVSVVVSVPVPPPAPPAPEEARTRMLAEGKAPIPWGGTKDPAAKGVEGDVVWDGRRQLGYMRFRGRAPNDPKKLQYQLWIFDKNQDDRHPVDGGVFDVTGDGEVVVPITAKLQVREPTLFAITIEKPGGVVVSSRERLVLAAKVPAG